MLVMVVFFIAFRWIHLSTPLIRLFLLVLILLLMPTLNFLDRKSGSAGMPRPISYAVFCLKKKKNPDIQAGSVRSSFQLLGRSSCEESQYPRHSLYCKHIDYATH